jgi:hypothetical protein
VPTDFVTEVKELAASSEELESIRARVKNLSKHGLFLETSTAYPVGAVLKMRFRLGPHAGEIKALGVVRWTRGGPERIGIGIHFVEVDEISAAELAQFIDTSIHDRALRDLTRTPLHESLLRLHAKKQGDVMPVGEIARQLGATQGLVRLVLRAFADHGLVTLQDDVVNFLVPEDEELRRAVGRHIEETT